MIDELGFHRSNIYRWLAMYEEGGLEALRERKARGRDPKLSAEQLKKLYRLIVGKDPRQLNFEFALWTREMVRTLIQDRFGVNLSAATVGRLLGKLGLSPQRPLYKAYQRDEEKVARWTKVAYPQIKALARKQGATIYFGDEASVRSDYHSGTTWAPIGQTPVVTTTGARFSVQMMSAVSAKGTMRFMTFKGRMNSERFIEFLKRLLNDNDSPVFLVVDGHPVHKAKAVTKFVESTEGRLRLFILPPYSPHLNPDEWVWNWLKNHNLGRGTVSGPDQFRAMVRRALHRLKCLPHVIRGFFRDANLAYI